MNLHNLCKNKRVIFICSAAIIASTYLGLFSGPSSSATCFVSLFAPPAHFDSPAMAMAGRHFHLDANPTHLISSDTYVAIWGQPLLPFLMPIRIPFRHRLTLNNGEQSQSWCAILKLSVTFVSDDARRRANEIWYRSDSMGIGDRITRVQHNQSWACLRIISTECCDWSTDGCQNLYWEAVEIEYRFLIVSIGSTFHGEPIKISNENPKKYWT